MKNPFTTINIAIKNENASPDSKRDLKYFQMFANDLTQQILFAVGIYDTYALTMFNMACFAMNTSGECEVILSELDSALGIKQARTRTKSLNLLRHTNLIKTVNVNKLGKMLVYVNVRAASNTSLSKGFEQATFKEELNRNALNKEGRIDPEWADAFRIYEKNKDKKALKEIPF
ncbi:hypothetical protein [Pseudomonas juntendi]|uniref:hypothetical protein n=1 Tax=Pseudomonas juntendi TaxID=2666183 RepID=UPI0024468A01|nr:hypothetical protein [Pseudomonas juntendi]MDG9889202.1 hypothetical protein [Pseudomonas juntendi]